MVTHSSVLAWEIPCTEKSDGLQSMECKRVGHDLATKQQQQHVKTIRVVCHFLLKKKKFYLLIYLAMTLRVFGCGIAASQYVGS